MKILGVGITFKRIAAAVIVLFLLGVVVVALGGGGSNSSSSSSTTPPAAPSAAPAGFLERLADQYKIDALGGSQSGMNQHTVTITNDSTPYVQQIHISDSWVNDAGHDQGFGVEIQNYTSATEAANTINTLTGRK